MSKEIIGNYEVGDKDILTRREVLLMGAIAAGSMVSAVQAKAEPAAESMAAATVAATAAYVAKDFSKLAATNMPGLSEKQISQHLKLYQGYVAKANEIQEKIKSADTAGANATYFPYRELLLEESYAVNGVILHEFYFGNLGGKGGEPSGGLRSALEENWGSLGKFNDYLKAAGKCMRGWVIVGYNTRDARLHAYGLDMHNMWVPACVVPILVLDVYEHAYMIDYGIDRGKYLDAFMSNLNWHVVARRFESALKHPTGDIITI